MKLGIGTAQFGLDYGVSNSKGCVNTEEVAAILSYGHEVEITVLDTAPAYGVSEHVIGNVLGGKNSYKIITKIPHLNTTITNRDSAHVTTTFYQSLERLKTTSIYGLLVHNPQDMFKDNFDHVWYTMKNFKQQGLVHKCGVSVYTPAQIDYVIEHYDIDLIQLPINVFDQRLIQSGHLKKLKDRGIEIHARSVFLQGLLLMDALQLPGMLQSAQLHLELYHHKIQLQGLTALEAALAFALSIEELDTIIVGICSRMQLEEIVATIRKVYRVAFDFLPFALNDEKILNPALWEQ